MPNFDTAWNNPTSPYVQSLLHEGKTKRVWQSTEADTVIIENTDRLTAYNGLKEIYIDKKARYAAQISAVNFIQLHEQGVPNHFLGLDSREGYGHRFWAQKLGMLPVEFVVRNEPWGSYLDRHPEEDHGGVFKRPVVEVFEKNNKLGNLGDPLLIVDYRKRIVRRFLPDQPLSEDSLIDERPFRKVGYLKLGRWDEAMMVARDAARVLQKAWERNNCTLVDIKFECGITSTSKVVIGDTIDADCWRLWQNGDPATPLDRQLFKNGCTREEITDSYGLILQQTMKTLGIVGNMGN